MIIISRILETAPTPELANGVVEECRYLLEQLEGAWRDVAQLMFQGYEHKQIAEKLKLTKATTQAYINDVEDMIRTQLQKRHKGTRK